ncbi:helicase-related protein [Phytoactinopolyspora halotolerans]|uniref:DEAD/DEAH box helicase family protein n=1 Tax=Phytoactinopolyspora halotolerans TaxID=1981512 RepID=A0A6L9S7V2_9ACTN|nr:helicase-related protein [Phytoactinopolyspora halotolerans]NEE01189.1 DEAD/DEAH box helicase family protein [Phytoactinopolyspora halotolerans]
MTQQSLFTLDVVEEDGGRDGDARGNSRRGSHDLPEPSAGEAGGPPGSGAGDDVRPDRGIDPGRGRPAGPADAGRWDSRGDRTHRAASGLPDDGRDRAHREDAGDPHGDGRTALQPDHLTRRQTTQGSRTSSAQPSLFDDLPDLTPRSTTAEPAPDNRRRRGQRRTRKQAPQAESGQLSLMDFDQPTPIEAVDPGGAPLPERPKPNDSDTQPPANVDFDPPAEVTVPSGPVARAEANLAALETLRRIEAEDRPATSAEQQILAGWSSWGALPGVFENDAAWASVRDRLREVLSEEELAAARRTVLNAHYTDPAVIRHVWRTVSELGFTGGRVLEPGCGSGNFIGHAPASADMVGVELDPITARIAERLYPSATIRTEGFEDTRLPEGSFMAAVGNVPFGGFSVFDPVYNAAGHNIHDHFIIKSLRMTVPGGLVAVLTSAGTMDKLKPAARRDMHAHGDLVGAVRLPSGAMSRVAGTDVVVDLLVLRRRRDDEAPTVFSDAWEHSVQAAVDGGTVRINQWFVDHPDLVLGTLQVGRGLYRADEMRVAPGSRDLDTALGEAIDTLVADARTRGLTFTAKPGDERSTEQTSSIELVERDRPPKPGTIAATPSGGFARYTVDRGWIEHEVPTTQAAELRELLALRDETLALIDAQATWADPGEVMARRARLNRLYDSYVERHGPINRYKLVQPKRDGAARQKRRPPFGGMRKHDPDFQAIAALELFDEDTGECRKAPVFTVDVIHPREPARGADTPADAVAISLDETGRIDVDRIAELLGLEPVQAWDAVQAEGLAFIDPASGQAQPAARYLSGNVREKLRIAREHAADPDGKRWQPNIDALERVQPPDLVPGEISVKPGVTWIPASDYEAFVTEVFEIPASRVDISYEPELGKWLLDVPRWSRTAPSVTTTWGTNRRDAVALLDASMNNTPVEIRFPYDEGGGRDVQATLAAQEKKDAIDRRFAEWVFADPVRATRLCEEYNRRFNSIVPPAYDGSALTLPGLGEAFCPRKHQRDAVARVIAESSVLLDHVVGAGKTGTMIMAGMELRRLGLARQPWYVVPNHLVEQFSREFTQWYPTADLLVGSSGMTPAERREFVAVSATSEWDAVIVPQSVFKQIPVSPDTEATYLEAELARIEEAKHAASTASSSRVRAKELEKALAKGKTRLANLRAGAGRDTGINFERTGCDYLFIDEAHHFKNKRIASGVREFDNTTNPSQQAEDLAVKLQVLRARNSAKVATFATATPVANSLREMYVMQAYLAPDQLEAAGVATFDTWAANFTRAVAALETDVTGSGFRMHTRIATFVNTPELLEMFRQFADVVARDDLDLPLPALVGGSRRPVITAPSDEVAVYQSDLEKRADRVRSRAVQPDEDNMLKVVNDGRKAALDPRLVDLPADPDGGRVTAVATEIMRIHCDHANDVFTDPAGQPYPRTGALQIVFCDRSTPTGNGWNFYTELRDQLTHAGLDPAAVRFIHEARNDAERGELFEACRDGRVSVLIGSTEKMGTGVNVQARAIALHHVDCPWRPADLEQREGRVIRQGNQNCEVEILGYATEGSLDVYMWQTVERKQKFIAQLRAGGQVSRTVDDIGDADAISYAEFKAASSGNPLILEREELVATISRLAALERAHHDEQRRLQFDARQAQRAIESATTDIATLRAALTMRQPTDGDQFAMTISGRRYTARADAGRALFHLIAKAQHEADRFRETDAAVGELGGFHIRVEPNDGLKNVTVSVDGIPNASTNVSADEIGGENPGYGLVRRLEGHIIRIDDALDERTEAWRKQRTRAEQITALLGTPFYRAYELNEAKERLADVEKELAVLDHPPPGAGEPAAQSVVQPEGDMYPLSRSSDLRPMEATVRESSGIPHSAATHPPQM